MMYVLRNITSVAAEVLQKVPAGAAVDKQLEVLTAGRADDDCQLGDTRAHAFPRCDERRIEVDTRTHAERPKREGTLVTMHASASDMSVAT